MYPVEADVEFVLWLFKTYYAVFYYLDFGLAWLAIVGPFPPLIDANGFVDSSGGGPLLFSFIYGALDRLLRRSMADIYFFSSFLIPGTTSSLYFVAFP